MDTRDKRASALACGLHFLVSYPVADGTVGAGDRQQISALYRAVLAAAAEPPPPAASAQTPIGVLIEVDQPVGILL